MAIETFFKACTPGKRLSTLRSERASTSLT
jgi:hypothetical protein